MSATAPPAALDALQLDAAQQEVLLIELSALTASISDPEARAKYLELRAAVAEGRIEGGLVDRLEGVLEMSLQTGRARRIHGPASEQALLRLFQQTPRGAAARRATEAVNRALAELDGHVIREMLVTVQGPGVYRLGIHTDRCRIALEIDRHGVSVESLEV